MTKRLGWHPQSLLPLSSRLMHVEMLLRLGQSSSSLFPAGSVDFGPDVTSSDKSIKVLLNSQDKVSPHKPWGSPLGGRRQSGPFPPLSLSRSGWGLLGPQSVASGTEARETWCAGAAPLLNLSELLHAGLCHKFKVLRSLKESPAKVSTKTGLIEKLQHDKIRCQSSEWLKPTDEKKKKIINQSIQSKINPKISMWRWRWGVRGK